MPDLRVEVAEAIQSWFPRAVVEFEEGSNRPSLRVRVVLPIDNNGYSYKLTHSVDLDPPWNLSRELANRMVQDIIEVIQKGMELNEVRLPALTRVYQGVFE